MNETTDHNRNDDLRARMLLQQYFEATLSESESLELIALWDRNEYLLKNAVFEGQIESALQVSGISKGDFREKDFSFVSMPNMDELTRLAAESPSLARQESVDTLPSSRYDNVKPFDRKAGHSWIPLKILVPVILILFGVAVYFEFWTATSRSDGNFVALAEITENIEAVWENGVEYKKGRELALEKLNLLEGIVRLRLKNNVEIVLEGPTEFVLRGDDETFCRAGKISATVPPEGKGFKIVTPVATVIDLGTEFSLAVDDEKIDVHVVKGVVDVARSGSDHLQLTTGLAAMLDYQGGTRQYRADVSSFFSNETVQKIWNDYVQRRRAVWEREERRRSEDPGLLVSMADVRVHGCSEVEGSRPGTTAFRFRSQQDCLDVSMPGEHSHLTLVAHVRIRNMSNYSNTLCLGSGFPERSGEFLWQLGNDGRLRFHVFNGEVRRFHTEAVVRRPDWNTWMQLAVVVDGSDKEIRHYLDGRRVAALRWENPVPLKMPHGAIGNAPPERRNSSTRFWNGEMDSFYAFSRAFSDAEVMEMYENLR